MKNLNLILARAVVILWMFTAADVMGPGPLTPPGSPGETMKTLAQVEPRTPISSLPYTIGSAGSYYVTGNLSSTTNGIVIKSSDVTVDLMGFTLTGMAGTRASRWMDQPMRRSKGFGSMKEKPAASIVDYHAAI